MGHERVIAFQVAPGARVLSASALCWPGAYPKATRARSTDLVLQQRSLSGDRGRVPCPHALALTHACAGADVRRRRGVPARRWLLPALPRHAGPAPAPRTLSARRTRRQPPRAGSTGAGQGCAVRGRWHGAQCAGWFRWLQGSTPPPPRRRQGPCNHFNVGWRGGDSSSQARRSWRWSRCPQRRCSWRRGARAPGRRTTVKSRRVPAGPARGAGGRVFGSSRHSQEDCGGSSVERVFGGPCFERFKVRFKRTQDVPCRGDQNTKTLKQSARARRSC